MRTADRSKAPWLSSASSQAGEEKEEIGLIPGLDPRVQYDKMKTAVGLGPDEQIARASYAEGQQLFQQKDYSAAAKKFEEAIERGPHSPIEQDAMFALAESYFFGDRYIKARDAYDALVKEHPNTRYMDTVIDREWAIARYWEQYESHSPDWLGTPNAYDRTRPWFDTIGHAIKTYDNIRLNDPTGPRADDAIMATANIYFERHRYDDADYHYTLLRREYPRSELQFEAHLLGLQAKLRKYQGADYDGSPLEEAKTLVKQLRMQFAGRLSNEEKERLQTVEAQLNQEIAHARLPHGRAVRQHEALRVGAALLCEGDGKVPEHRAGVSSPNTRQPDQRRAGQAAEAAGLAGGSVPREQRAVTRQPRSRAAKRRHAAGPASIRRDNEMIQLDTSL